MGDADDVPHPNPDETFVHQIQRDQLGFEFRQVDLLGHLLDVDQPNLAAFCLVVEASHEIEALLSFCFEGESHADASIPGHGGDPAGTRLPRPQNNPLAQDVVRGKRDGPTDDEDMNQQLAGGELQVEGTLGATGERKDDEKHHGEDGDAVESAGDERVPEEKRQVKAREHVDGRDDACNDEVEGDAQGSAVPASLKGARTEKTAGHPLEDALRIHAERCGLRDGGYGVEGAADEGGEQDCLKNLGHVA
jgi:hypothetical protein